MSKLKTEEMANAINYEDVQTTFFDGYEKEFGIEDLEKLGKNEDEFPFSIEEFKKLDCGFSKAIFECSDFGKNKTFYCVDEKNGTITIDAEKFTIKEFIIIIDMISRHLVYSNTEDFVSFGDVDKDKHVLYHGESSVFGCWWEDFYKVYMKKLKSKEKINRVQIFTSDYETDDERMYVKDRVINIVLF